MLPSEPGNPGGGRVEAELKLMMDQPSLFWGLVMSFWIGNLLLLVLNIPLIGLWVRMLLVPSRSSTPQS